MDPNEAVRGAYQAWYRRLVGQVYVLTTDLAEAEDVVQEAIARHVTADGAPDGSYYTHVDDAVYVSTDGWTYRKAGSP